MKRVPVLHPFLFTLYPILALFAYNIGQVEFRDTFRPASIALLVASGLLLILSLLLKNVHRAGLAVTAIMLLFFSYGHVYLYMFMSNPGAVLSRADVLAALWAVGLIVIPWFSLRVIKPNTAREMTVVLNVVSAAALVFACQNIGAYWLRNGISSGGEYVVNAHAVEKSLTAPENAPDIYYLIVDTYGRQDVLQDLFGEDQQEFMDYLDAQGFFVAQDSTSNYPMTLQSLSSSLNMQYIERLIPLNPESNDLRKFNLLIGQNQAAQFLKQHGYQTIFISSNYLTPQAMEADLFLSPFMGSTLFEWLLVQGSIAVLYVDSTAPIRTSLNLSLDILHEQVATPGPKFVVYYTTLLHTPLVFDKEGNAIPSVGLPPDVSLEKYQQAYAGQLGYTNKVLQEAIQKILDTAERPPVIVIQGDHGSAMYFIHAALNENICLRERFGIMNAYYLPGAKKEVYDSITPVNTFRVIFNTYFGQHFELLPDRAYFSTWDLPYAFTDVTDRTDECAPLEAKITAP